MFKFGNDYEKKSFTVSKKCLCIVLTLSLIVTVFSISATAGEYTGTNKSKYHLANWYGLDELPYGSNTGVVYLHTYTNKHIDLTICYDKCTPMSKYMGSLDSADNHIQNALIKDFTCSHLVGFKKALNTRSVLLSVVSDSPILYTYGNTGENWKTLPWTYCSSVVQYDSTTVDGQLVTVPSYKTVYVYLDIDLSTIGFSVPQNGKFACYSNKLAIENLSGNYRKDNIDLFCISFQVPLDSQFGDSGYSTNNDVCNYIFACYPTSQCLRDWQLWSLENENFNKINEALSTLQNLYFSLGNIEGAIYEQNEMINQMNDTLSQIMHPEDYPAGGLLNDKSFSDKLDGVLGDISSDTSAGNFINTLSASFMVIRGIWDKIVSTFGLYSVIGLLLFLAFTAYLFGRALKGRDS